MPQRGTVDLMAFYNVQPVPTGDGGIKHGTIDYPTHTWWICCWVGIEIHRLVNDGRISGRGVSCAAFVLYGRETACSANSAAIKRVLSQRRLAAIRSSVDAEFIQR